jgi:hypothetical protein
VTSYFGRNRREKPRFTIKLQVLVVAERLGVKRPFSCVTRNISETGLFLYGKPKDFAVGPDETHLTLTMRLDDCEWHCVVEIMHRADGGDGFGVKIVKIAPEDQERLNAFLAAYAAKHPEAVEP